jgi:hypothetical protein
MRDIRGQRRVLRNRCADLQSVSWVSRRGARKRMEHAQVQTMRWRLFQTAGKIVWHGQQVFLKAIGRDFTITTTQRRFPFWC